MHKITVAGAILRQSAVGQARLFITERNAVEQLARIVQAQMPAYVTGWHCNGRAQVVGGKHTHLQTDDNRVLPNGNAYKTDVGMTGPYDSVIGMKKEA